MCAFVCGGAVELACYITQAEYNYTTQKTYLWCSLVRVCR